MKKYILILTALCFFSCEDYLEMVADVEGSTVEVVFNDFTSVSGYFNRVYAITDDYLRDQSQGMRGHFKTGEMADEGANARTSMTNMGTYLNRGVWNTQDGMAETGWNDGNINGNQGNVIPKSFYGIRISNRILEEVPHLDHLTVDQKGQLIGQAYFFRAWFFFEIIRRVGGFPLLDRTYTSDETGNMERKTYAESTEWLIENLDEALKYLPDKWDAFQTGRPTKSSALALKSMAMLYSASPLMRNGIDRTDVFTDYDEERVKLAAEYANDCLKYLDRQKDFYNQTMMDGIGIDEDKKVTIYSKIFYYTRNEQWTCQEALWYINSEGRTRDTDICTFWQTWQMTMRQGNMGTCNFSPTQNIINKFETRNGYPCELMPPGTPGTAETAGWLCDDPEFDHNEPFRNRDPRLENFIILPGEDFGNHASAKLTNAQLTALGLTAADVPDNSTFWVATWEGGRETNTEAASTQGGRGDVLSRYLVKKYMWPACTRGNNVTNNYADNSFATMFIRTTQVWLDYAEAMNEAYGPTAKPEGYQWSAAEALNMVRNRVGMPDVEERYPNITKLVLRERIRNERAVELLCENHRWFDIRRWMIAEDLFNKEANPIKRAKVTLKDDAYTINLQHFPPGRTFAERRQAKYGRYFNYEYESIREELRIFDRKHYWYPMRKDEVDRYPLFKQNPGW